MNVAQRSVSSGERSVIGCYPCVIGPGACRRKADHTAQSRHSEPNGGSTTPKIAIRLRMAIASGTHSRRAS